MKAYLSSIVTTKWIRTRKEGSKKKKRKEKKKIDEGQYLSSSLLCSSVSISNGNTIKTQTQ